MTPRPPPPPPLPTSPVRLVDGASSYEGRVEILHDGEWGTVCDDQFDDDARVVCRSLGHSGGTARSEAHFGAGDGYIWLDDVQCEGYEPNLDSCEHLDWGANNCDHYEDVSVICDITPPALPPPPRPPPLPPAPPGLPPSPPAPAPPYEMLWLLGVLMLLFLLIDVTLCLREWLCRPNRAQDEPCDIADDAGPPQPACMPCAIDVPELITLRIHVGEPETTTVRVYYNDVEVTASASVFGLPRESRRVSSNADLDDDCCSLLLGCMGGQLGSGVLTVRVRRVEGAVLTIWAQIKRGNVSDVRRLEETRIFVVSTSTRWSSRWNFRLTERNAPQLTACSRATGLQGPGRAPRGADLPPWARNAYNDLEWTTRLTSVRCTYQLPFLSKIRWYFPTWPWCICVALRECLIFECLILIINLTVYNALCVLPCCLTMPGHHPWLFGLFGNGLWLDGAHGMEYSDAIMRFVLDVPPDERRRRAANAGTDGIVVADDTAVLGPRPIPLLPVAEPELLAPTIAQLTTPMDLPSELDFYHLLSGPRSSPGQAHGRISCTFCGGTGELTGWTIPAPLVCPMTGELMADPCATPRPNEPMKAYGCPWN